MLTGSRENHLTGTGDPSVQFMEATPMGGGGGGQDSKVNISKHELRCGNGGPKSDGEWYDPNQAGQQVTAHCVIL